MVLESIVVQPAKDLETKLNRLGAAARVETKQKALGHVVPAERSKHHAFCCSQHRLLAICRF